MTVLELKEMLNMIPDESLKGLVLYSDNNGKSVRLSSTIHYGEGKFIFIQAEDYSTLGVRVNFRGEVVIDNY